MKDLEKRVCKTDPLEFRAASDDGAGTISGYAAVFDKLSVNLGGFREQIAPGAFDGRLNDDVRALFNHDPNRILGRTASGTLTLKIDEVGLRYTVDPLPESAADEAAVCGFETGHTKQLTIVVERTDCVIRICNAREKFQRFFFGLHQRTQFVLKSAPEQCDCITTTIRWKPIFQNKPGCGLHQTSRDVSFAARTKSANKG